MDILGIDVGGSGIKGAIVRTETGEFIKDRYRIRHPDPSKTRGDGESGCRYGKAF